jgi:hypothetical protein
LIQYVVIARTPDVTGRKKYSEFRAKLARLDDKLCAIHSAGHYDVRKHDVYSSFTGEMP